jgi:hypothetical protein
MFSEFTGRVKMQIVPYVQKKTGGPGDPPISFNLDVQRNALHLELPPVKTKPDEPGTKEQQCPGFGDHAGGLGREQVMHSP